MDTRWEAREQTERKRALLIKGRPSARSSGRCLSAPWPSCGIPGTRCAGVCPQCGGEGYGYTFGGLLVIGGVAGFGGRAA